MTRAASSSRSSSRRAGGRVVDACAGAGGKTLAIGASMANKGRLLALDTDGKKLEELRRRARRAGLTNVAARPVTDEGTTLPSDAKPGGWDACSSTRPARAGHAAPEPRGALAAHGAGREGLPGAAARAARDLRAARRVGGRLIYATCSVVEAENEGVVARFLADRDDFVRVPVKEIWGKERAATVGRRAVAALAPADPRHRRLLRRGVAPRSLRRPRAVLRSRRCGASPQPRCSRDSS